MAVLQEYKCPCCGGAIAFDAGLQKMKCPFCDTEFEMEALAAYDSELQNEVPDDMKVIFCFLYMRRRKINSPRRISKTLRCLK